MRLCLSGTKPRISVLWKPPVDTLFTAVNSSTCSSLFSIVWMAGPGDGGGGFCDIARVGFGGLSKHTQFAVFRWSENADCGHRLQNRARWPFMIHLLFFDTSVVGVAHKDHSKYHETTVFFLLILQRNRHTQAIRYRYDSVSPLASAAPAVNLQRLNTRDLI